MDKSHSNDLDANYWIDKSENQYQRGRYEESIISAENAIGLDEDSTNAWWFSALSYQALNQNDKALEFLEIVVDLSPNFANGWSRYGTVLQTLGYDYEALAAFERTVEIDDTYVTALTALASIYREIDSTDHDDVEKEIYVLTRLDEVQQWLTSNQLNRLGVLYYNSKRFFDAIKYWDRNVQFNTEYSSLFNLGLAYNHPEVSQDTDAIDIWRLTIEHYPDESAIKERISRLLPRLLVLAEESQEAGKTVLDQEQWYQHYVNPFELLNYQDNKDIDADDVDIKKLQKLRKRLIQELELEDGYIPWMENLSIDRSKIINLCDELNDEDKRSFHLHIFRNKPLLGFLSCGEHQHFSVDSEWSPLETLEYLEETDNGFRKWLSEPFTKQFDMVLSKTIDLENLAVLEVLLDGRRWIESSYTEKCFENAKRKVSIQLDALRRAKKKAENKKPTVKKIKKLLNQQSLIQKLNLFPTFFWNIQDEAVGIIRSIAVSSFNIHDDSALAKEILNLTKQFSFKSTESNRRINEDISSIEEIIQKEKQFEARLTMGKDKWEITQEGVLQGTKFIKVENILSVRWGGMLSGEESSPVHDFLFVFNGSNSVKVVFHWKTSSNIDENNKFNHQLIDAILNYIIPQIIEKQKAQLNRGNSIMIGHCQLTFQGIHFESKGLIFSKPQFIPWHQAEFDFKNGNLIVMDAQSTKIKTKLSLRNVNNAFTLQILKEEMC